jgi:tRNA nucleotidyltransferase/poly(A) polymerase
VEPPRIKGALWLERAETQRVLDALEKAGHVARAVGGAVRNTLIGEEAGDIDIATDAPPEEVKRACEAAGLKVVPTGLAHGTVTVVSGHIPYEVTTLRHDVETDGRHAKVAFTDDWEADARRRDFTMNALFCDRDGKILDLVGGYEDLLARRVRFIGDAAMRIREDYLRILRFFRFSAAYGRGQLDPDGLLAAVRARRGLDALSAERVRAELVRLIVARDAAPVVEVMAGTGILGDVLGGVAYLPAFGRLAARDSQTRRAPDAMLRLGALAVRIAEDTERLAGRLKLSSAEAAGLELAARQDELARLKPRLLLYRLGPERFRFVLRLAEALDGRERDGVLGLPERWQAPRLPLRGDDLIGLGATPGPALGAVLARIEAEWIAADFSTGRAALIERAKELLG